MNINLIVIDDDTSMQNDPWVIEAKNNFPLLKINFFPSAQQALPFIKKKIDSAELNIIMLDLSFPSHEPSGDEVLKTIRNYSHLLPVIVFTAADEKDVKVKELINYKTTAFLTKTSSSEEIIDVLKNVIQLFKTDIASALEEWIKTNSAEMRENPYIYTFEGTKYTLNDILFEIRKDSQTGREFTHNLMKLTIDLIARNKEALHD